MTLPRDKESVLADLPTGLKSSFLYLADQLEAVQQAADRHDALPRITLRWPTAVPLPSYLVHALANCAGEEIALILVP